MNKKEKEKEKEKANPKETKEKKKNPKSETYKTWEKWARKGNFRVKDHKIVQGLSGPGTIDEATTKEFMVVTRPHGAVYTHSYGLVSKFFKGLLNKVLYGTTCPVCGTTYCPPRAHCWNPECRIAETEWIELPLQGVVHTFSIMLFAADAFLDQLPFVLGYIQIDTTDTAIPMQVVTAPTNVFTGQKVKIKFRDTRKGELMDIYAVPVKGQKIPDDSCLNNHKYITDLERDLQRTYTFLEERFNLKKEDIESRWTE
ncbi:MAG: Zn-ribbon domain-containing OB-fold protein [Candidatus Methanofastidiosia archaeon]|jgi:uncharacterized OB-fold protein